MKVGEHMEALVLQKEDKEGRLILSKKRAQYERAWGRIEEVMQSGQTIKGPVIEVVKGGLILDIGLRGFLPASLVDLRRVRDLQPFVGTELECKIIELDRNRNNVVLSRRAFLEESQSEGRKTFLQNLQKGERRKGTVSSIVNFGAFVDLGGVDGLVHVSELSWKHVDHPQEVVAVGQEVEVEVLDVDLERERVSLSLKATQEDPWKEFERTSQAGAIIDGTVTKLVPFGAFVRVAQGIEGLVHISEISHEHVDAPESVLSVGQEVQVKVIDVDVARRRVSLSMRQVSAAPPKPKEIEVEPEVERDQGPEMSTAIEVPAEILAAVAAAEEAAPAAAAATPAPVEAPPAPSVEAPAEPAEVPAEPAPEAPAQPVEAPGSRGHPGSGGGPCGRHGAATGGDRGTSAGPRDTRRGGEARRGGLARADPPGPEAARGPQRVTPIWGGRRRRPPRGAPLTAHAAGRSDRRDRFGEVHGRSPAGRSRRGHPGRRRVRT